MQKIDLKVLLEAGSHFGHKTNKWHPSAARYIYKAVGDIHIIDLLKTKQYLEAARDFIYEQVSTGKEVLFVGTKRQAAGIVKQEAQAVSAPFINSRWIGGFITNWKEVKKNIEKFNQLENDLKDPAKMGIYTKLERVLMDRERGKLEVVYGGVRNVEKVPEILFVIDARKEKTAILEAQNNYLPVVGIVDTNTDARDINYIIPANDDAVGSVSYITHIIAEAYQEGKVTFEKNQAKAKELELKQKAELEKKMKEAKEKETAEKEKAMRATTEKIVAERKKAEKAEAKKVEKEQKKIESKPVIASKAKQSQS